MSKKTRATLPYGTRIVRDSEWREWIVVPCGHTSASDSCYRTDDWSDACFTGAMIDEARGRRIDAETAEERDAEQWEREQRQTLWAENGGHASGVARPA